MARDARLRDYQEAEATGSDSLKEQLARFNRQWDTMRRYIPYYAKLVEQHQAPRRFEGWDVFLETFPVANRSFVYENLPQLVDTTRPVEGFRTTGGSTAEPISLPAWNSETDETERNEWMGRGGYGIGPEEASFRLWGHSHLLGKGWKGWINAYKREWKDALLGIERMSAYDLSDAALLRAFEQLQTSRASYMVGYSAALDRFARVIRETGRGNRTPLKAVVATSESFPRDDSREVIEAAFGAPVAMEYGSVETGVLAHTRPGEGYHAFWLSYFIEAVEPAPQGGYKVRVTSLYPRAFPLVRYDLGDALVLDEPCLGVRRFEGVLGRSNAFLEFGSGERIHSEAVSHAVKGIGPVSGYQMVQENEAFTLCLTTLAPMASEQIGEIRSRLEKIHPRLGAAEIRVVERLEQTRAGKTPLLIRR
jgi:phenylacetate-CoA ligase